MAFSEKLVVASVDVKPGQSVDAGQELITGDATDIQNQLNAAQGRLAQDTNALNQAQAAAVAQQRQAAQAAANAAQTRADRISQAQGNLNTARANLQKLQAPPSQADVEAAQNAVTAAQIAERKAEADQVKSAGGPDPNAVHAAEQELANADAAVARAQADLDRLLGTPSQPSPSASADTSASTQGPIMAANISPSSVTPGGGDNNYGFQAIAVDPTHPGTVYVGTCYQGLWRTTDSGRSWLKVNTGTNASAIDSGRLWSVVIDPANSQTVYAVPGYGVGGVWKSADAGVNWTPLFPPNSAAVQQLGGVPTPSNIVIDPNDHLHIIASSHFWWGGQYKDVGGVGVLETKDGGNTWIIHAPISGSGDEHQVGLIDSNTWLDSTPSAGMFRTTDSGATWAKVTDRQAEAQSLVNVNGTLYVPSAAGLLRSSDHGASWQVVGPGGLAVAMDGQNLYTQESAPGSGHSVPLYYSAMNDGSNWAQYSTQTMCLGQTCDGAGWMSSDPADHAIYMSDWSAGVWKLQTVGGDAQPAAPVAAPAPAPANDPNGATTDVLTARQRLQTASDNADAARAKLAALRQPDSIGMDSAQLGVDQAKLAVSNAQAKLNQLRNGPSAADLKAARDAVTQAQTALDRAQAPTTDDTQASDGSNNDLASKQAAIDKDNADIGALQDRLNAATLVAPFAGTVVTVRVKEGDKTDPKTPVLTIAKPGTPVVNATIAPNDMDKVSEGQSVQVSFQGQTDAGTPLMGTISTLTPNDAGTNKQAVITLTWPGTPPKYGAIVNLGVVLQSKDDALIVPKKAVRTINSKSFVQLVNGRTKKITAVQVGIVGANDDEITSGLADGQLVVVGP